MRHRDEGDATCGCEGVHSAGLYALLNPRAVHRAVRTLLSLPGLCVYLAKSAFCASNASCTSIF